MNLNSRLFQEAKRYIVGGVNSPVRSFKAVGGTPIFVKKASGSKIFGEDGKTYIDYCLSWGALLLGHAHRDVISEVKKEPAMVRLRKLRPSSQKLSLRQSLQWSVFV